MKHLIFLLLILTYHLGNASDLPIGHPSVKEALDATGAQPDNSSIPLPNVGKVINTIQTTHYTYIEVLDEHKGAIWLAAPKVDLKLAVKIRYGRGISMVDFYSNSLQREFPEIYFVERVEVVK